MSVSKLKQEVARSDMMHDLLQPTEIALHRSSTASHISSRTWIAAQKPGSQSRSPSLGDLLDFYLSTFLLRSRSTTQLATHGAAPKSIGREVDKKCPVGASKHGRSG